MSKLAITGGTPVRTEGWPGWPVHDEEEVKAVEEVVRSGDWGGIPGNRAKAFAADFAEMHDARFGIGNCNGTTALEIALKAAGIGPGDEVIVPAITFYATVSAVVFVNAVPAVADVDPDTYAISPESVASLITDRTRAIMPVHIYGSIADLDALQKIAHAHNLIIVEDCAHMHGGKWRGRGVGSYGLLSGFSLQQSKAMTSGEGGITLTSDPALAEVCHSLVNCGRFREEDTLRKTVLGWNYRLTELQAAILQVQLKRLPAWTEKKAESAEHLESRLRGAPGIELLTVYAGVTRRGFYCYALKYVGQEETGVSREQLCRAVNAEGVSLSPGTYPTLNRFPLYNEWEQRSAKAILGHEVDLSTYSCPNAERAQDHEACLFPHQRLLGEKSDIDDIADAILKVLDNPDEARQVER